MVQGSASKQHQGDPYLAANPLTNSTAVARVKHGGTAQDGGDAEA
jgi:hypothetical protein